MNVGKKTKFCAYRLQGWPKTRLCLTANNFGSNTQQRVMHRFIGFSTKQDCCINSNKLICGS